ncbi:MAG: extra-cytoplasmic solute receptor family protein 71 [Paucimonas sp.]|nr:extra-cytoplasmic solute receptor family protein 71 [Paucimonas sp.]
MRNIRNTIKGLVFTLGLAAALAPAQAQTSATYPSKIVKMIVGFPAGNATDIVARMLAERMSNAFGQPVIIENRPGQGGSMALDTLARSAPDGYTMILAASGGLVTNPHLYKGIAFNPTEDFEPVSFVADMPLLLVANPSRPFDSVKALVDHAKKNPGKLSYGSTGVGTSSHLAMESLKRNTTTDMLHVPYQGSVKAATDLIAGNVDVMFDTVAATRPHVMSGKLKLLAAGSRKRMPSFPNAPTLVEAGFPEISASVWLGMLFPKGTPADIVNKVNAQLAKDLADPALEKRLLEIGVIPNHTSPKEFAKFIRDEYVRLGKLVQDSGVKAN